MSAAPSARDRELALMALVARKYYLADLTKSEIGEELHLSRFQVARLLQRARQAGVVRIEVGLPGSVDDSLAAELRVQYSLRHAVVIDAPDAEPHLLLPHLSQATMRLLTEIVTVNDVLGLASARTLLGIGALAERFVACPVVQLTGAISHPDATDIIQSVRALAQTGGGTPYSFYAPILAANETARQTYLLQPDVQRALAMLPKVTVAVVGIGLWAPGLSTIYDIADARSRRESAGDGVVAEVGGILLGADGFGVDTRLARCIVAPTFDQLRNADVVIGAAFNAKRAAAVRTAMRAGLVNALVTHRSLAMQLLEQAGDSDEAPPLFQES